MNDLCEAYPISQDQASPAFVLRPSRIFPLLGGSRFFYVPYAAPSPWKTFLILTNSTSSEQGISARYFTPDVLDKSEQNYVIPANYSRCGSLRLRKLNKDF